MIQQAYEKAKSSIIHDFLEFLKIPSISTDAGHVGDMQRAADFLRKYLEKIGFIVRLIETGGHPILFAEKKVGEHLPTVMIYHHYDVQPADPEGLWQTLPFSPEIRNERVYARGALDNKGQCFCTLGALRCLQEIGAEPQVNLKLFIEGEEEIGSYYTMLTLPTLQKELSCDALVVLDSDLTDADTPAITTGMRGIACMEVRLACGTRDLHSGHYGGFALNPNRLFADVIHSFWHTDGSVAVEGFYDNAALPDPKLDHGTMCEEEKELSCFVYDKDYSVYARATMRPTLEINGLWGGYIEEGFKTVIPFEAHAKISCRLVPGQDPDDICEKVKLHIQKQLPKGVQLTLRPHHGAKAFRSYAQGKYIDKFASSLEQVFHKPCEFRLAGGSVPIAAELAKITQAEMIVAGFGLSTNAIHSPNEWFGLDQLKKGILTMAEFIKALD